MIKLLILVLIESLQPTILKDAFQEKLVIFLDPIALIVIVFPILYLLIFKPLNQQAERKQAQSLLSKLTVCQSQQFYCNRRMAWKV